MDSKKKSSSTSPKSRMAKSAAEGGKGKIAWRNVSVGHFEIVSTRPSRNRAYSSLRLEAFANRFRNKLQNN